MAKRTIKHRKKRSAVAVEFTKIKKSARAKTKRVKKTLSKAHKHHKHAKYAKSKSIFASWF